jgi:endonuclease-3
MNPNLHEARKKKAAKMIAVLKKLYPKAQTVLHYSNPWELLVSVILSAQCTDKKVNEVTEKLFKKYPKLEDYVKASPTEFEQDIKSTGFYRAKTKNVLAAAKLIKEGFGGKIPATMEEMLTLPGVARKTANVVLYNTYGKIEGVAVDTHVKRLSKLYGLTDETDPVKIEKDLMEVLPKPEWMDFTFRIVLYGREYCVARPHDHAKCPLVSV